VEKPLYRFDELRLIPKRYGIYVIHHLVDDKQYVGKGMLYERLRRHKLYAMRGDPYLPLYMDMHHEGLDTFRIEVVHVQDSHNKQALLTMERATIAERAKVAPLYNRIGSPQLSRFGVKRTSGQYLLVRYNGLEARGARILPKNLSGIYKIYRQADPERVYIGQSVDLKDRCSGHVYYVRKIGTQRTALYQVIHQYGIEQFCFEVIETCPKERLLERERYWIQAYNAISSGYNDKLPQTREELTQAINERLAHGQSVVQIAEACDVSRNTVRRVKALGVWLQFATEDALIKRGKVYDEDTIRAIRVAHAQGWTVQEIMDQFGFTYKAVDAILNGGYWQGVEVDESQIEKIRSIKSKKTDQERRKIKEMLFSGIDLEEIQTYSGYTREYLAMILKGKYWTDIHVEQEETYQKNEPHPTLEEVAYIKYFVSQGKGMDSELARQYHINRSTVRAIRSGERWKDVVPHAPANAEQSYTTLRERQADPRKLTRREVAHIKYLLQRGVKVQELAHKYGVPHSAISKIKSGARWPDVLPCAPDAIQLILLGEQEGS